MSGGPIDFASLERDVRRAAALVDEERARLAAGGSDGVEARELARRHDPFAELRHTAGQATYKALLEMKPSAHDAPARDGLVRWVYELLQARVCRDLALDEAAALHAVDARLPPRTRERALLARGASGASNTERGGGEGDGEARTYAEAMRAVLVAEGAARAATALEHAADLAAPVSAVRKEMRARRFEAARRLGLAHPAALAVKGDPAASARALLDATEGLAADIVKAERKKAEAPWRASSAIELALARGAREGWPARPLGRWLDDVFRALAPRGVPVGALPQPLGAATFLRAASAWGFAYKTRGVPRSMTFAFARDPYSIPAWRFGAALASAVAEPAFQRRALGLPSRLASAQARALRVSMLLHARAFAARVVLGSTEAVDASTFEEMTSRAFGAPLPAAMRDAWPVSRADDPSHLVALLVAPAFVRDLVGRFDEDWFDNPKAGRHLTSLACGPAWEEAPAEDALSGDARALGRAFEEAIG